MASVNVGDQIAFSGGRNASVIEAHLDRTGDRGVFVRLYEASGQPYMHWVREENIESVEVK